MVTVPHKMVGLERMSDYRGVGLERFHCTIKINLSECQMICGAGDVLFDNFQFTALSSH